VAANPDGDAKLTPDRKMIDYYIEDLQANGPQAGYKRGDPFVWFPLQSESPGRLITVKRGDRTFALLANTPQHTMLSRGDAPWG